MNVPSSLINQQGQTMIGSDDYQRLSLRKRNLCNYNETGNDLDNDLDNDNDNDDERRSGTVYSYEVDHQDHDDGDDKATVVPPQNEFGRKPVQQLDPQTKTVVAQFPSVTSAAKAMQVSLPAICLAIRKYKQQVDAKSAGFLWRHAPEDMDMDMDMDMDNSNVDSDMDATSNERPQKRVILRVLVHGEEQVYQQDGSCSSLLLLLADVSPQEGFSLQNKNKNACDDLDSMRHEATDSEALEEDSESESLEQGNELDDIQSLESSSVSMDDDDDDDDDDDATPKMTNKLLTNIPSHGESSTLESSSVHDDDDDDSVLTMEYREDSNNPYSKAVGRPGLQVEQLCLQTGQVLQSFASILQATKGTGFAYNLIRDNLDKVVKGFFWRRKGSHVLPPTNNNMLEKQPTSSKNNNNNNNNNNLMPKPKRQKASTTRPVEKTCLTTGKVLARLESISMAAKSVGVAYQSIHGVVTGYRGQVSCKGYGWRYASSSPNSSAAPSTDMTVSADAVPASTITTAVVPNLNVGSKGQETYSYIPQSGDRFRVFFETVKDCFGERKEAAGWYTGTATHVTLWDDNKYLLYLLFDDHADDNFLFPAADIQRLLPALPTAEQASSNKVFAFDGGSDALQVAYEYSPDHIEVGDVVCCNYQSDTQAEGQWYRGRVAKADKKGKCDVVFDDGDHHCKIPKKRLRLMERGRDTKGWVVGLSINKLQEHRRFGKLAPAKILRVQEDERVVLMFPNWLEVYRPYEQVAAALMREVLEKVKVRR